MNYDKNYPSNQILIKDIPGSIRKKGEELVSFIKSIEENKSTSNIKYSLELFPFLNVLYVNENNEIPKGIYFKNNTYWVGYNDYEYLPSDITGIEVGTRLALNNQIFELRESDGVKVWSSFNSFQPILFYDLFEYNNEPQISLHNRGLYSTDIAMNIENLNKTNPSLPYCVFSENSKMYTTTSISCPYTFTFSALFDKINRTYSNNSQISVSHNAILMFIKDEFNNVRIALTYDAMNHLSLFIKDKQYDLSFIISDNQKYQITLKYINNHIDIIIDNQLIKSFPIELQNKLLFFSIGNDMSYGKFANGSFIISEPSLYKEALSIKELIHSKNFPRTWNLTKRDSYLDLTLEEKLKLKAMLK